MTARDIAVAQAIVSCHETFPPTARPRFGQIAILRDGPGGGLQTTFGAHQATDRSDSLDKIIVRFRELAIAAHGELWDDLTLADDLEVYLPRLAQNTPLSCAALARDAQFLDLLKRSATDPLMKQAQQDVFDEHYMKPALAALEGSKWVEALSLAVIYDMMIHGGWAMMRDETKNGSDERSWIKTCVQTRHWHLAHAGQRGSKFGNPLLRNTVYRMKTFETAINSDNWGLATPIRTGNGVTIIEADVESWMEAA